MFIKDYLPEKLFLDQNEQKLQTGQGLIEYALIILLIVVGVFLSLVSLAEVFRIYIRKLLTEFLDHSLRSVLSQIYFSSITGILLARLSEL